MRNPFQFLPTILCGVGVALSLAAAEEPAAETGEDGPVFGAWKIHCESVVSCQAYVNLAEVDTNQLALTASFHFVKGASGPTGVITLPLGVALKPGVRIRTESEAEPIKLEPEVCYPDGCRVVLNPTDEQLAILSDVEKFSVVFFAYGNKGRSRSIDVPTDGLDEALDYLAKQIALEEESQ
ncbi:MAG: invasion associated locus B family protein [Parvularculaceae bacterium]